MSATKGLKLVDILTTIVISVVFGIIYKIWGPLYYFVKPFGFHVDQLIYGMWFIAASVAYLLIRKPGVALLAEIAASSGEFIMGSEWGLEVLIYGVVQGLLAEVVFAAFRYKRFDALVVSLGAIGATIGSLVMDFYKGYIESLAPWNLALFLIARFIGAVVIAGVFAVSLVKALEKTGVTQMLRPASKEDYDALDR
ncbi:MULTISPECIES: ECF transporter S component [Parageobacillus]|jgi:energy-coupling factor transport system permease protein|uniref:Thiamine ABC transporter permease n=1 Tax=Parageobacillus galactosidasius TaxID=883812 RepID=A0A226QRK4_9BACL|nr:MULTISPECIES: ECF transporter S component [Parageobacillus]MED4970918.1 ECF transporter S component [Parageobacillus toebii]OXB94009.1 thiamine ABC transporter permease [Parageobacillus galactosidasius]RDV21208.1 thiamine ABC transporter permease [Parageobacillus toebii]WMT20566.1 ECF transporter S component [Parageobacillus toebii]